MLTQTQRQIIAAVEAGHTTTRSIAEAIGIASNSAVSRQLEILASGGHIVLRNGPHGKTVARGADFCTAWDAAARLAGNPDA